MTIRLELDPTLEATLLAQAQAHGVAPENYAKGILREALAGSPQKAAPVSSSEFESFLDAMKADISMTPELRKATFDRDMIYNDHD